jgi:hypothetical protein
MLSRMSAALELAGPPSFVTQRNVEQEVERLFGSDGLVVRVLSDDPSQSARNAAFTELLDSLKMYGYNDSITVESPGVDTIARGLDVLSDPQLQRRLFQQILLSFGGKIVDPLAALLETSPLGLRSLMTELREALLVTVGQFKISHGTASLLRDDMRWVLTDEYLAKLADHEEKVQRPQAAKLAQEVLHLIGATFQRAFNKWPAHARVIAESVARRMGARVSLPASPAVIRDRIVEGIEDFLWGETSHELDGALAQLMERYKWVELVDRPAPVMDRAAYREFAVACWELVSSNA